MAKLYHGGHNQKENIALIADNHPKKHIEI